MIYMNPRPDQASIGQFYPEDYEAYQTKPGRPGWWGHLKHRLDRLVLSRYYNYPPKLTRWQDRLTAWLARPWFGPPRSSQTAVPFVGQGRLLDYGCGSGDYALRMRERGWDVTGMDFSARAAREAEQVLGQPVLVGTLPHPAVPRASFDMITMGAVLEHVHWPHTLIEAAAQALRPDGLLVVSVPNIDSFGFRAFGEDWWPLELPRHLLHFTPATLRRLLESHGLRIQEVRLLGRGSWMRRSFDRSCRPERPSFRRTIGTLGKLRIIPSLLTSYSVWTRQADCVLMIARRPSTAGDRRLSTAVPASRCATSGCFDPSWM
jgi:2-polyprenyl-3-methyl-5-hydroxy-6-metoxy-1,4-benzoquinol methylase